ncbi:uncharacterized protein LOC110863611 [Folsomia candida]|uniref:uncharacterized protein LOC110863611 n=1 Tax=Folsomia candida TaxID=158441 RepID=UPI000B90820F|nr:uncharacterized protein LOC110863611 [Folsomia candida]
MSITEQFNREESEFSKRWLGWCRSNKNVKCTETPVSDGILPKGYKGILIDVKVHGNKGPDDKLYATSADLRNKVARGNCVLELQKQGSNEIWYMFLVFALKKFSGGMGDEDESPGYQNLWQNYFLQTTEHAVKVICTKKANGEAAHFACRNIFGENYFCLGSKNVHLLVKTKADIEKYNDSRYLVARTVAETFFQQIVDNCDTKLEELVKYLNDEKCTIVGEILQPKYQHIENLSHLESPQIHFICWTSFKLIDEDETLCPKPPNVAIDEARSFGLLTVDYEIIDADASEDYMAKIRTEFGYEGRVLYFADKDDNIIGVLKKKTAWYIILRCLREKMCHFSSAKDSSSLQEKCKKVTKRIQEIQRWIGFSDEYMLSWTNLGTEFVKWLTQKKLSANNQGVYIRSQFPILWQSFLDENAEMMDIYSYLQHNYS